MTAAASAASRSAARRSWLRVGTVATFIGAAGALAAAVAGGVTEPTGIATVAAVIATVVGYGLAPLLIALAIRLAGVSSWWAVLAALLAAVLWLAAGVVFVTPELIAGTPAAIDVLVGSAPTASALWLVVASTEIVRAGMLRWSLVAVSVFLAVLIVGSMLIELSGFDIRRVLVPLGWAIWMIDAGVTLRRRTAPQRARPVTSPAAASACANCGAPRRTDGLAFCGDCGLPYRD
jgi:hypothetical protein